MAGRKPLSAEGLMRRATLHLARHAASTARLREVLARAAARGADGDDTPDAAAVAAVVEPVIAKLRDAGLLDDAAFARGRAARLARKGKPASLIAAELRHRHGIDPAEHGLGDSLAAIDPLTQATRWAERRRLGPFRLRDRAERRERDIASLVRAGFPNSIARTVIDGDGNVARTPEEL